MHRVVMRLAGSGATSILQTNCHSKLFPCRLETTAGSVAVLEAQ